jgi:P4 family phage/plasmid primase-like protien
MEAIDGITDPWMAGTWILEQMKDGFYHNGRFFVFNGEKYDELTHEQLQLLIMRLLKEKCTQAKINIIVDRLRYELPHFKENDKYLAFDDCYIDPIKLQPVRGKYIQENKIFQLFPFKYDVLDMCPKWYSFLDQIFDGDDDHEEKKSLLQEFFGYVLLRDVNLQKALVLYGDGGNGKSIVLDVLAEMVPKVSRLEWGELGDQRGLERLADSWLNLATEISYKETNSTTGFKKAIAMETMTANPKYKQPFDFKCGAKFAFATNGLPMVDDPSSGVFRRLIVISLNNSFVGKENWNLSNELKEEIPGIFNWALIGAQRLRKNRTFTHVPSNIQELQEYRRAINSLQSFYDESLEMYQDQEISFQEFYRSYTSYCLETSNRPYARNKIRSLVKQLGLELKVYTSSSNIRVVKALAPINWTSPFS